MASKIQHITSGLYEDCMQFMEAFEYRNQLTFEAFGEIWKEKKFSLVFTGKKTYYELLDFCEESLNMAKQFIVGSDRLIRQVFGLYLLYGLYFKIPIENVKISVSLNEWKIFLNLYKYIKEEQYYDASYIFIKLLSVHAFHHSLFAANKGLEKTFKVRQEHRTDNPYSVLPNIIHDFEEGELANLQQLSKLYDEQKAKLLNASSKAKLELFDKNFMDDMIDELESLQENRHLVVNSNKMKLSSQTAVCHKSRNQYSNNRVKTKLGRGFDTDSSSEEEMDMLCVKRDNHVNNHNKSLEEMLHDDDDDDFQMNEMTCRSPMEHSLDINDF